jgi:hypothetical protein
VFDVDHDHPWQNFTGYNCFFFFFFFFPATTIDHQSWLLHHNPKLWPAAQAFAASKVQTPSCIDQYKLLSNPAAARQTSSSKLLLT